MSWDLTEHSQCDPVSAWSPSAALCCDQWRRCYSDHHRAALHCLSAASPHTDWRCHCCTPNSCSLLSSVCETRKHVSVFISEIQSYVVVFKMFDCEVLTKRGVRQAKKQKKSIRIHPAGWSLREKHIQVKTTKLHIWIWLLSIWR